MPSVSVLITYFNEAKLLTECLESLAAGGDWPDEVLIHDDASAVPPERYIPSGKTVRVIRSEKNVGPAAGRNKLIEAAQSEFIHFHDSDDLFHPEWLKEVRESLKHGALDCVFTEIDSVGWDGSRHENILELRDLKRSDDGLVRFCLEKAMLVPSGTHRTSSVRKIGGYRTSLWQSEDWDFHVRLAASGVRFAVIGKSLVTIRVRRESRSQDMTACLADAIKAAAILHGELESKFHPSLADAAARFGSQLFKLGKLEEAKQGFQLARKIGHAHYDFAPFWYGMLSRLFGQGIAERAGIAYRTYVPAGIRHSLRRDGHSW